MTDREGEGSEMASRYFNGSAKSVIDAVSKAVFIIVSLFVAVVAFEGKSLIRGMQDHEARIAKIEGNRYTSNEALQDWRRVNESVSDLRTWIEQQYPPIWLKEDVQELKAEVRQLREMISARKITDGPI